jgi:four helix bundle protein
MAKSFEEMEMWKRARELVKFIYRITKNDGFCKDFSLTDQIRRAAVSVMSNIAEGFERGSNTEFIQFLYIAKGSAGEVRTQLYAALDQTYISGEEFKAGKELCVDISGQISGLIQYLKGSRLKGEKFKTEYKSFRDEVQEAVQSFYEQKRS